MAIEHISDECAEAVTQAHEIGNEIGLKTLKNEILFAGIVARPERAADTLERFQIRKEEVRASAVRAIRNKPNLTLDIKSTPNQVDPKSALPFHDDAKITLNSALQIADRMESQLVRSEHVLLALLGYNNGQKIVSSPAAEVLGDLPAFKNGRTKVSVFDF
jgi:ATP-dependent Clp protease ATP-binding subunit ClpA